MIEQVEGLKTLPISFSGGVDEVSPSDSLEPGDAVKFTNWRLSKDGKRIQKRAGLYEEYTSFGEDIYGLSTYFNSSLQFCQVAVLESQVMRKVAAGAWANLFTFSGNIDHVVKPLEINGKQFIITEKGSKVIQADGNARQIGISAPTTIPSLTTAYVTGAGTAMAESWVYPNQGAMDAAWLDSDQVGSSSTLETTDPYSTPGPEADQRYAKFVSAGGTTRAMRTRTITSDIGQIFAVDLTTYFKLLNTLKGPNGATSGLNVDIYTGKYLLALTFTRDGVWLTSNSGMYQRITDESTPLEKWIRWTMYVDGTDVKNCKLRLFRTIADNMKELTIAGGTSFYAPSTTNNYIRMMLHNYGTNDNQEVWIDSFYIRPTNTEQAVITGTYRYAISFYKTGDYGCESNPIKSKIGTVTFSGAGLNDMTVDSESTYTGSGNKTLRVKVKTAAATDIIQWSEDKGSTWSAEVAMASHVHLAYGVVINFGATTGHTATNYWEIPCYAISTIATMQQVTLTDIPKCLTDDQVDARKIYRSTDGGATFYYLTTIFDNVTTTFVDNMPDMTLGELMEEDRDLFTEASSTVGKFCEYWDGRLWIADHVENIVYYSAMRSGGGVPEEFDIDGRFIPIQRGTQGDVITAMKAYKDSLYVFKRNDIYIIQKTGAGYGAFHLNSDLGCIADGCVEEVNDFLSFPSERGIEIYDGMRSFSPTFSIAVSKTFLAADSAGYKYMSMVHDKEYNELWLSIPSTPITIVWNYIRNKFYFFSFYKTPSCLVALKDSTGKRVVKMGTRDGYLCLCDYGTADHTTPITATYRKGWLDMRSHGIGRLIMTDYEIPYGKSITLNVYVDMQVDCFRTASLTGISPTSVDADIRRVIGDKTELGIRARWMAVEYVNAEDCGGDCKLNEAMIFVRPDVIKKKTYAD